jgi:type II secretory pathway predicted ATPase ExeA
MFLDFYGLKEQPFGVTPDPHFLYLGASHREALASLSYGVKTGRGLLALIAPPGMGKTTLLFRFLEHLRRSARTVFLFQTQCDSKGLLHYLLGDLGIKTPGQDLVTMHDQLNAVLLEEARAGRRFVLVIDEAQNLDDAVLETARLLSNFETPNEKLLQIVLAGQPQLAEKLERPELLQLRQRISIWGHLEPFSPAEVNDYINHRLRVAGCSAIPLFTSAAVEEISVSSQGIPRNINNLCFNALSLGCALGCQQIDADLVDEVAADLELSLLTDHRRQNPPPVLPNLTRAPADKMIVSSGEQPGPSFTDTAPFARTTRLSSTLHGDPVPASQHPYGGRSEPLAKGDVGVLFLEFEEHAEARNAEILAEIVEDDGTSGDANRTQSTEKHNGTSQIVEGALKDAEVQRGSIGAINASGTPTQIRVVIETIASANPVGESEEQLPVGSMELMTGNPPAGAGPSEASPFLSISYAAERKHTIERLAVAVAVFVLALLAGIPYRQDIKTAAAQTRRSLVATAVRLASSDGAGKIKPTGPAATSQDASAPGEPELSDRATVVTASKLAPATPIVVPQADSSMVPQERQAAMTIAAPTQPMASPQMQVGTTMVIVRPNENLRIICLRYLGRYDARAVREIRGLNPEINDLNRVTVGQRIMLPGPAEVEADVRRSLVPSP